MQQWLGYAFFLHVVFLRGRGPGWWDVFVPCGYLWTQGSFHLVSLPSSEWWSLLHYCRRVADTSMVQSIRKMEHSLVQSTLPLRWWRNHRVTTGHILLVRACHAELQERLENKVSSTKTWITESVDFCPLSIFFYRVMCLVHLWSSLHILDLNISFWGYKSHVFSFHLWYILKFCSWSPLLYRNLTFLYTKNCSTFYNPSLIQMYFVFVDLILYQFCGWGRQDRHYD